MKSVLITGGSGTFGQAFVPVALKAGVERICIFSRGEHRQAEMRAQYNDSRIRYFIGDVRDRNRLRRAMEGIEVVVHAAALKRIEVCEYDVTELVETNINGTVNVIEAATDAGVQKVVGLSTDKACDPVNAYGASKLLVERLLLAANKSHPGTRFAAVRYGNIWGSNGSVVPKWLDPKSGWRGKVPITDPECTRFFMLASEATELVMQTIRTMKGGELVIPDLPAYRLGDLAEAMKVKTYTTGLPEWEKLSESMKTGHPSHEARRMSIQELQAALAM